MALPLPVWCSGVQWCAVVCTAMGVWVALLIRACIKAVGTVRCSSCGCVCHGAVCMSSVMYASYIRGSRNKCGVST